MNLLFTAARIRNRALRAAALAALFPIYECMVGFAAWRAGASRTPGLSWQIFKAAAQGEFLPNGREL